ncbi:hypothetical protein [Actinorugispora endophytica]|uniref:Uncharacterized protein n=1 Tax=Actinorugispora endophytica TaxID=1605990 RepID=A0A4R6UZZ8_9ACTN|nr:hypothetical protein [Actinorugispora endophytica]TDQ51906.1 hypothetical protein EV190_10916 [Actinorugispora endophytica]
MPNARRHAIGGAVGVLSVPVIVLGLDAGVYALESGLWSPENPSPGPGSLDYSRVVPGIVGALLGALTGSRLASLVPGAALLVWEALSYDEDVVYAVDVALSAYYNLTTVTAFYPWLLGLMLVAASVPPSRRRGTRRRFPGPGSARGTTPGNV